MIFSGRGRTAAATFAAAGWIAAVLPSVALVFTAPSVARAGTVAERARALATEGKVEEAEKALDAALPGLSGDERREARRLHADLLARHPERAAFEKARALLQELAAEDEADAETRWVLYELVWARGERLVAASKRVEDGAALVREAKETFAEGAKLLEGEWRSLEDKGSDATESALAACGFYWPRCLASLARLEGDKKLLEKAVEVWMRSSERCAGRPETYEAAVDLAEALVELRRPDEALAAAESGVAIEEAAGGKLQGGLAEVFERASLVKARILLAKSDTKKALAVLEKGLAYAKADERSPLANLLRIERAAAWARDGKTKEALDDLERVAASDPTGSAGDLALQRIAALTGSAGAGLSSERALRHMNDALDRGQPSIALAEGRAALAAAHAEAKVESELTAVEGIGRALEAQKRLLEARIAFEEAAASPRAPADLAKRSALAAVRCAESERAHDPGAHANAVCERVLALLERRDPAARKGLAPFLLARQLQDQRRFAEAACSYDEVAPEAGAIHDEALYAGACCRFMETKNDPAALSEIAKRLTALLARPRTPLHERGELLLADVYLQQQRPERVVELIVATTDPALQVRALALVRLGRLEQAEALVATLLDRPVRDRRTASACRELAAALAKKSVTLPDAERRSARAKLAPLLAGSLDEASAEQALSVARESFVLALDVLGLSEKGTFVVELDGEPAADARPLLEVAAGAFEKALAASKPGAADRWKLLACRAQALAFAGSWKEAARVFATLASEARVFTAESELDAAVLAKNPLLVGYVADLGAAELHAGETEAGRKHLALVLGTATEASRLWWLARLAVLRDDERRGTKDALAELSLSLRALARKYPDFAAAKELAPRFVALAKRAGGR